MIKQIIVIRRGLGMRRGKEIAQGSHASMAFMSDVIMGRTDLRPVEREWLSGLFTKACLQVDTEEELKALHAKAEEAGLRSRLITDAGLTEFKGVPTITCLAIGPDESEKIDPITGHLKLY